MKNLPPIRTKDLVTQETGDEILVYDLLTNKAFCLNETSAKIYNACGNHQNFSDLKSKYNFTEDLINLALDELNKNNLLAENYNSPISQINRREVIKKVGLASMVALPVISSLIAPKAAQAGSNNCSAIGQICSAAPNFSQGDCCADLRCINSSCNSCVSQNGIFLLSTCNSESDCSTICNTTFFKNACCNSGTATSNYDSGTGGIQINSCYCP